MTHFTNLNSLDIEKYMPPRHSQKPFSFYKFPTKHLVDVIKNIDTAPFLDAQELPSRSTLKVNVCIFLYIYLRKFLFQRRSKLLAGFFFICCITSLRQLTFWALQNVLEFFSLIEIFRNLTICQHFDTSIYSIKTRKFSKKF